MTLLLVLFVQSTLLLSLGFGALYVTRRRGPAIQTLVGRATLSSVALLLLLLPLSGRVHSVWAVSPPAPILGSNMEKKQTDPAGALLAAPSVPTTSGEPASRVPQAETTVKEGASRSAPTPANFASSLPSFRKDPASSFLGRRAVGLPSLFLLFWLAACQFQLVRLRRAAQAIAGGPAAELLATLTPNPPALLTHASVTSPFLAGLRRSAIFLPPTYAADFDPDALQAIFVHELAHRERRDNFWTLAACLLSAVLWFQPLLWLLCRKLEQISEDACDQAVLASHCQPRAYAACLLSLAEHPRLACSQRTLTAGVAPFHSSVGRRISRILTQGVIAMSPITLRLRLTIAALTLAAVTGGAFLVSSAPAQTQPNKPEPIVPTAQERQWRTEWNQDKANLKAIGQALIRYEGATPNLRLPDANHWMDQIAPYLPDRSVLFDPFQPGKHRYGYALNRNCSKQSMVAFSAPAETVVVFDSTAGTRNASDAGASLRLNPGPEKSQGMKIPPISGYGFVDGHIKFFTQRRHPSFLLAGGMPSIDGNDHDILGAWVSPSFGAAKTALIFSNANIIEEVGPWPGDTRKLVHFYGRYNAHPTDLKYIFTRVWVEGKPMSTIAPEKHLVDYALSQDGQTITLKDKSAVVYRHSHTYTTHKPKGFLWI